MQTAVIATAKLSVRLFLRAILVFCSDERRYDQAVFSVSLTMTLVSGEVKLIRIFAGDHSQRGR